MTLTLACQRLQRRLKTQPTMKRFIQNWIVTVFFLIKTTDIVCGQQTLPSQYSVAQWVLLNGSSQVNQLGKFGVKGTPSAATIPGARYRHAVATHPFDASIFIFGGTGYGQSGAAGTSTVDDDKRMMKAHRFVAPLNDLWKWDQNLTMWTWMSGSNMPSQAGTYGTLGQGTASTVPSARCLSGLAVGLNGSVWVFGGSVLEGSGLGNLNDMWEWSPSSGFWTWWSGVATVDQAGVYGTKGIESALNVPGSRQAGVMAVNSTSGALLLFGGHASPSTTVFGVINDLWQWNVNKKSWTWISGSNTLKQVGVFGTAGVAAATNVPGGRMFHAMSIHMPSNTLYVFGGWVVNPDGNYYTFNDLWSWDAKSQWWTWWSGYQAVNSATTYGNLGYYSSSNIPSQRLGNSIAIDELSGVSVTFAGSGYDSVGTNAYLNDVWMWDPILQQWAWVGGKNIANRLGSYSTLITPNAEPGSRNYFQLIFNTATQSFYAFGGKGYGASGGVGFLNDLWQLQISIQCPDGFVPNGLRCTQCLAGTFKNTTASNDTCVACPENFFCTGGSNITLCSANSGTLMTGAQNVSQCVCNPGYFGANGDCQMCPQGSYCPGNAITIPCPLNSNTSSTGATSISQCACNPSYFGNNGTCTSCTQGSYCPGNAISIPCPLNSNTSSTGASSVSQCTCNPSYFGNNGTCISCPPNSVCNATSYLCQPGFTSTAFASCSPCPAGTFKSGIGNIACSPCAIGTYQPSVNASSCSACPLNSLCHATSFICLPGYVIQNGNACVPSPITPGVPTPTSNVALNPSPSPSSTNSIRNNVLESTSTSTGINSKSPTATPTNRADAYRGWWVQLWATQLWAGLVISFVWILTLILIGFLLGYTLFRRPIPVQTTSVLNTGNGNTTSMIGYPTSRRASSLASNETSTTQRRRYLGPARTQTDAMSMHGTTMGRSTTRGPRPPSSPNTH